MKLQEELQRRIPLTGYAIDVAYTEPTLTNLKLELV